MGKGPCTKYTVVFTRHCDRIYRKAQKKMDARLYGRIEAAIESIEADPLLGKNLTGALAGKRSVRIGEFRHRIVYEVDDVQCLVTTYGVGHRSRVYDDLISHLKSRGLV